MSAGARWCRTCRASIDVPFLTNTSILALDSVPRHLVVVGGSYVGLEFAQMYRRFGAEVTVVEKGSRLIGREDDDVSDEVRRDPGGRGHRGPDRRDVHRACAARGAASRCRWIARTARRRPSVHMCCLRSAAVPTPTTWASTRRVWPTMPAATSLSTTRWRPTCRGSGRSATATVAAPSRTRPTTTSRSSPPTCSTAQHRAVRERVPAYALYIDPPLGRVGSDRGAGAVDRAHRF